MIEHCQWFNDPEIGLWHLPGCWGAVVGGPECCYCGPAEDTVEARLAAIESQMRQLLAMTLAPQIASQSPGKTS